MVEFASKFPPKIRLPYCTVYYNIFNDEKCSRRNITRPLVIDIDWHPRILQVLKVYN